MSGSIDHGTTFCEAAELSDRAAEASSANGRAPSSRESGPTVGAEASLSLGLTSASPLLTTRHPYELHLWMRQRILEASRS